MTETADTVTEPTCELISIETLRSFRRAVYFYEWLLAQAPWQRPIVRKVRERLLLAA